MNDLLNRISTNPAILSGKPCIKGTRIPVHLILDFLAAGEAYDAILREYPTITKEDINACIKYAATLAEEEAGVVP